MTLRLADDIDIARGDTIVAPDLAAEPVGEVSAVLCWLSDQPLAPRGRYLVKHGSATVQAIVTSVDSRLDLDSLSDVPASGLGSTTSAACTCGSPSRCR